MTKVKTRFAPSPTGYLHIGGARTALFNWLFARHHGGKFVLRIEDTDLERSTRESVDAIFEGLGWLGLDWDEEPEYQSRRTDIYLDHIDRLLKEGKAYRCYCSKEELDEKRAQAMAEGRKPKYDGKCRERGDQPGNRPFTIRFKAPTTGVTAFDDMIKGRVSFENSELDDLIIARTDGSPTYNFVVVVDDATMGITHIIRGDDHLNNTPRQILLYEALTYTAPEFGHVPLILGEDKKRLSKRHGATSVTAYKDMGYLPHAMINYLARLGWSHGDQELFSIDELVKYFDSDQIGKSAGIFNPEKLLWLNAHYIKESSNDSLAELIRPIIEDGGQNLADGPDLASLIAILKDRVKTTTELAEMAKSYYLEDIEIDGAASTKFLTLETNEILKALASGMEMLAPFDENEVERFFKEFIAEKGLKMNKVGPAVRVALTGGTASPGIFEVIAILGKDKTVSRINRAIR
ncbi:MAG: glutamate--tRNA ligase [bacterium]|nr:glutamate--tRNA ligase [bacterium]